MISTSFIQVKKNQVLRHAFRLLHSTANNQEVVDIQEKHQILPY